MACCRWDIQYSPSYVFRFWVGWDMDILGMAHHKRQTHHFWSVFTAKVLNNR